MGKGISTHSLTRRLTGLPELVRQIGYISTHSLTRRLTITSESQLQRIYISTHSLTRRLTFDTFRYIAFWIISTHSLTRRLTGNIRTELQFPGHFNSQPHKEADTKSYKVTVTKEYFNSQPHKEADGPACTDVHAGDISTHSLTRRLT